jgi:hypothetical protein
MTGSGREPGRGRVSGRAGKDGERGASTLEFAIVMPSFILLIFLLVQAGLYFHAANVAQAVAQTTAREISTYRGAPGADPVKTLPSRARLAADANQVAVRTWQDLDANHTMRRPDVTVGLDSGGSNLLTVEVTSTTVNLLPGLFPSLRVTSRASGPVEVFKPQDTN